jgi:hypothetical protein
VQLVTGLLVSYVGLYGFYRMVKGNPKPLTEAESQTGNAHSKQARCCRWCRCSGCFCLLLCLWLTVSSLVVSMRVRRCSERKQQAAAAPPTASLGPTAKAEGGFQGPSMDNLDQWFNNEQNLKDMEQWVNKPGNVEEWANSLGK